MNVNRPLLCRYGNAPRAAEAIYNLIYALGQHQYDPDCALFFKVRDLAWSCWAALVPTPDAMPCGNSH